MRSLKPRVILAKTCLLPRAVRDGIGLDVSQKLYVLIYTYIEERNPPVGQLPPMPNLSAVATEMEDQQIRNAIAALSQDVKRMLRARTNVSRFEELRRSFTGRFGPSVIYKLTDSELHLIQTLINELRDRIAASREFGEGHKRRLLRRLEEMQQELHQRISSFDRFLGFIAEASPVVKAAGENLKPIADRLRELGSVIMGVISTSQGYPALHGGSPLLLPDSPTSAKSKAKPKRKSKK